MIIGRIEALEIASGFLRDIEGNLYKTITYGNQLWMAKSENYQVQ